MNKVKVYNQEGKESGELKLNEAVFGVKPKNSVVHQVYVALRSNARQPWADTKSKGEVRGGGRKPWKQKGTGRARHGSIRSPIWVGGGITFGPLSVRNYQQKVNKKMSVTAVKMCLADKLNDQKLLVIEVLPSESKTKILAGMLNSLPGKNRSTLLLVSKIGENLKKAAGNLSNLTIKRAVEVNVVDLLHHQYVLVEKDALKIIEERLV